LVKSVIPDLASLVRNDEKKIKAQFEMRMFCLSIVLLPNFYYDVRAHLGAEGAAGAGGLLFQTGHVVPLVVDPVT
jgi:hypothetical protein